LEITQTNKLNDACIRSEFKLTRLGLAANRKTRSSNSF